jgi:hypothetical protein
MDYFIYCFMVWQLIFYFSRFDTKSPGFNPEIRPGQGLDISIREPSGQVTGFVDRRVGYFLFVWNL